MVLMFLPAADSLQICLTASCRQFLCCVCFQKCPQDHRSGSQEVGCDAGREGRPVSGPQSVLFHYLPTSLERSGRDGSWDSCTLMSLPGAQHTDADSGDSSDAACPGRCCPASSPTGQKCSFMLWLNKGITQSACLKLRSQFERRQIDLWAHFWGVV